MLRSILTGRFALLTTTDPSRSRSAPLAEPHAPSTSSNSNQPVLVEFQQEEAKAGLLVTDELQTAVERVRKNVDRIAKECRARNSKFRDIEFDIEEDRERCLHGLNTPSQDRFNPSDVRRVSQIFSAPQFFVDGPNFADVVQGELGDCWFLSGIATVASMPGLVEKFCVAKDETVGVYGFTFQKDGIWTDVIIDDLLYTAIPKYEELSFKEKSLYHENKDRYNRTARVGGKSLYFAKSGDPNETWVPLLEKAYAKLHGDFASLNGGSTGEAIEDLTGGVSTVIHVNDILDPEVFWTEELLRANKDRLFSCSIYDLNAGESGIGASTDTISGLYTGHAYSILKAVEFRGKRFLRLRNPWGNSEWTGRWADGSREWTSEWLDALEPLGHTFGDDGAFIMEYQDFLDTWTLVHRSRLFDPSWIVSSLWLNATVRPIGSAWDYGDVSFTFTVPKASPVIVVLSQLDDRYYQEISGLSRWTLDFKLYKKGETELLASSRHSTFFRRSVNAELDLTEGEYVVHVRIDRQPFRHKDYLDINMPLWNQRKLASVLTKGAVSSSIVSNFTSEKLDQWLPRPLDLFAGRDLHEIEIEAHARAAAKRKSSAPTEPPSKLPDLHPDAYNVSMLAIDVDGRNPMIIPPSMNATSPTSIETPVNFKFEPGMGMVPGPSADVDADPDADKQDEGEGGSSNGDGGFVHASAGPMSPEPATPSEIPPERLEHGTLPAPPARIPTVPYSPQATKMMRPGAPPRPARTFSTEVTIGDTPFSAMPYRFESPVSRPQIDIHLGISCNGCGTNPIVGVRYKCLEVTCEHYDLCSSCFGKKIHEESHRMLAIASPEDADHLSQEPEMDPENEIGLGLRVYSKRDCPTKIKGQLRHGKLIRWQ